MGSIINGSLSPHPGTRQDPVRRESDTEVTLSRPESRSSSESGSNNKGGLINEDDAPLRPIEQQSRTWKVRNPKKQSIPVKERKKRAPMTEAQKSTLEIARKQKQIKDKKLEDEVSTAMSDTLRG